MYEELVEEKIDSDLLDIEEEPISKWRWMKENY